MREILFRGKCVDDTCLKGKWLEGQILHDGVTGKYYINRDNCLNESDKVGEEGLLQFLAYEVDPKTVCQYTGLADKEGRKIFEGDIVKTSRYGMDDGNGHNHAGFDTFSVEFSGGGFCLKNKWRRFNLRPSGDLEVIGNIFDNPKLTVKR